MCLGKLNLPSITKCGHTFCAECIKEVINLKHECPLCMAKIDSYDNDVVRNFALEKVLKLLQDKKEAETKAYFDELVNNAIKDNAKDLGDQIVQTSSI